MIPILDMIPVIFIGVVALVAWGFIWYQSRKGPLRWATPTSLFATGNIILYILPSLYWQIRPWNSPYPDYFDGLPLVLGGLLVLALPFLRTAVVGIRHERAAQIKLKFSEMKFGTLPWIFILIILAGIAWRFYLFSLGHQARLTRENPTIMGSESLALMIGNVSYYYPICYFALIISGDKIVRRIGVLFWIMDGLLQLYTFHRYAIIIFTLRSVIFVSFTRFNIRLRHWVFIFIFLFLVLSFIGTSYQYASKGIRSYMGINEAIMAIESTKRDYFATDTNIVLRTLDEAIERLYEARSASAVMMGVPDVIPYFNGETFVQVFYSFIPRYFWENKPNLGDIQAVTTWVMLKDSGINPAGTLAELYMNFGFIAILLGGILCFFICRWTGNLLARKDIELPIICVYPVIAELFIAANMSLTRRLSEGVRGFIVLILITLLFKLCRQRLHNNKIPPIYTGEHKAGRRLKLLNIKWR